MILFLLAQGCTIFEKDEKMMAEHTRLNGEKVGIYRVGLGATTNDVFQVRKGMQEKPVWVSERYNYLRSSHLYHDTILQFLLSDTGYGQINKIDTVLSM